MNKTKLSWTVSNIEKMHEEKKVLSFDHPIQRKSEMWDSSQKSLLIHSMLANYPVPSIYVLREDSKELDEKKKPIFNYFVMDGKQRLTSVLSYLWGEFPLEDSIPNIFVEETEYEIAGKYFCDLDEPVQYEIKRYKFDIIAFEECSNREIEEIFFRLNNSTELTKSQVAKAKIGVELAGMINELLTSRFFTTSCNFSKAQLKASDDQKCLLQAMMLLDTNNVPDFELKDFSETAILEYSESIRENYSDRQSNILKSAIQYLTDAFPEKNKQLRKISIPMLIYLADVAEDAEIKPRFFRDWWNYFTEEDGLMEVYKTFCSTGSTKLDKIKGRLAVMARSFCIYHETDIPEELKSMVAEVEEKLAAREENQEEELTEEKESLTVEETENAIAEEENASDVEKPDAAYSVSEEGAEEENTSDEPIAEAVVEEKETEEASMEQEFMEQEAMVADVSTDSDAV